MRAYGLELPERELRFWQLHPEIRGQARQWRLDFAWRRARVALEIEGGAFVQGRHTRGVTFEADAVKHAAATLLGWRVFKATARLVRSGAAITWVDHALRDLPLEVASEAAIARMFPKRWKPARRGARLAG